MKKKLLIYLGFFLVLLIAFYFAVFKDYDFSASKLKVINPVVGEFSFTDQNGKTFTQKNTQDKVYVAEYFFTTCAGICPKMNANMRRVWDEFKDNENFIILSHTCMPEVDSVPLLKKYEQKMVNGNLVKRQDYTYTIKDTIRQKPNENKNWFFVTGDKQKLYTIARQGYMIDDGKPDSTQLIKNQFIHTQFFSLVDKQGRVRGIYDGLQNDEIEKMMIDIKGLLKEKITTKRFMTGFSNNPG